MNKSVSKSPSKAVRAQKSSVKQTIKVKTWKSLSLAQKNAIFRRSQTDIESMKTKVKPIIEDVRENGDKAIEKYTKKFDKFEIPASKFLVKDAEFEKAEKTLDPKVKKAIKQAVRNVKNYHSQSIPKLNTPYSEVAQGILIGEKTSPIDSVGMYIPNGKGCFPSMVYMLAVPAQLANVPVRVMVSPPNHNGTVDPACLYAAKLCKVHNVYKVGGAQAIAALAFGTKTIPAVNKIIGPASSFVSAAKMYVRNHVDVGLPAGPSESLIIADGTVSAELAAYDLCIEAEHGPDSMAILITHKEDYAHSVATHLNRIIAEAPPEQSKILSKVFEKYPAIILCNTEEEAINLSNDIAPEHLMIHAEAPNQILTQIRNAGEILLGQNTPFSLANYSAGANAVLPTGGMAKTYSAVSIHDFLKKSSIVKITKRGFDELNQNVQNLAEYEGFYFHKKALAIRSEE